MQLFFKFCNNKFVYDLEFFTIANYQQHQQKTKEYGYMFKYMIIILWLTMYDVLPARKQDDGMGEPCASELIIIISSCVCRKCL